VDRPRIALRIDKPLLQRAQVLRTHRCHVEGMRLQQSGDQHEKNHNPAHRADIKPRLDHLVALVASAPLRDRSLVLLVEIEFQRTSYSTIAYDQRTLRSGTFGR